ncbi:phosphoribosylglycinamide formyltransferase [Dehalogenimonas etheniformans]|uniref:phosphoribosylglycinamide formyltransferase 1 n=1 Tax=Dehalogenimonas etheniformans TaxID=1536648 RepID=A0A2P5P9S9_9CHLR|nr:formyltransferase family protein [Dehalogenimonas etheniformans]PPD59037.1 phosphoglycerate transporter [Dehalogenimonas etheniformans]QNT76197.1 phosphoglycerate transporter [Dehalogenimonas etheniformans]
MYPIGWFTTAKGQGSRNLLTAVQERILSREIDARIEFIFMSREPGESPETDKFIELAKSYGIPLVCFSYKKFREMRGAPRGTNVEDLPEWRLDYDREIIKHLAVFPHPELCIMAGYMLVIGPELCAEFDIVNLHPAAPDGPAGTWQEVIWKLIDERAEASGVTMHLVTPELDKGPVVTYCRYPIAGPAFDNYWSQLGNKSAAEIKNSEGEANPLFKEIRRHGAARELPLIGSTVKAFSRGLVAIKNGVITNCSGRPIKGIDLSAEINSQVQVIL